MDKELTLKERRENIQKIFKEDPELEKAFKESIEEMRKPENMKKMVEDTCKFIEAIKALQK